MGPLRKAFDGPASLLALRTLLSICSPFTALPLGKPPLKAEIQLKRSDFSEAILVYSLQREYFPCPSPNLVAPDLPLWAMGLDKAPGLFLTSCTGSLGSQNWSACEEAGFVPHVPGLWHLQMCSFPLSDLLHLCFHSPNLPAPILIHFIKTCSESWN